MTTLSKHFQQILMTTIASLPLLVMAAPNDTEALQGHWRLQQAGREEN